LVRRAVAGTTGAVLMCAAGRVVACWCRVIVLRGHARRWVAAGTKPVDGVRRTDRRHAKSGDDRRDARSPAAGRAGTCRGPAGYGRGRGRGERRDELFVYGRVDDSAAQQRDGLLVARAFSHNAYISLCG